MRKHCLVLGFSGLLLAAPAQAIWPFGPSNSEDCVQDFAVKGASRRLVRAGVDQCRKAFDAGAHRAFRKQSLCIAKQIPDMKSEAAFSLVAQKCGRDAGVAECRWPELVNRQTNTCQPAP